MKKVKAQFLKDWQVVQPAIVCLWLLISLVYVFEIKHPEDDYHLFGLPMQLMIVFCSALLFMQDSPVNSDSMWRTQPVDPRVLIGSKLLMIFAFVLVPIVILQVSGISDYRIGDSRQFFPRTLHSVIWLIMLIKIGYLSSLIATDLTTWLITLIIGYILLFIVSHGIIFQIPSVSRLGYVQHQYRSITLISGQLLWLMGMLLTYTVMFRQYRSHARTVIRAMAIMSVLFLVVGYNIASHTTRSPSPAPQSVGQSNRPMEPVVISHPAGTRRMSWT